MFETSMLITVASNPTLTQMRQKNKVVPGFRKVLKFQNRCQVSEFFRAAVRLREIFELNVDINQRHACTYIVRVSV